MICTLLYIERGFCGIYGDILTSLLFVHIDNFVVLQTTTVLLSSWSVIIDLFIGIVKSWSFFKASLV